MEDEEVVRKQKFLRMEIIDKGYNPEEFADFLLSRKDDGDNVNNWTLNDLVEEVQLFQQTHKKINMEPNNIINNNSNIVPDIHENQEQKNEKKNNINNNEVKNLEGAEERNYDISKQFNIIDYDALNSESKKNDDITNEDKKEDKKENIKEDTKEDKKGDKKAEKKIKEDFVYIDCLGIEKTEFSRIRNLRVSVSNFKKIYAYEKKRGLNSLLSFIKGDFMYFFDVTLYPSELVVQRNFDDFYWLREKLITFYPGIYIPPLKKKKIDSNSPPKKILNIQKSIEFFLNSLIKDPLLLGSELIYYFLTAADEKDYDLIKNQHEEIQIQKIPCYHQRENKLKINSNILNISKIKGTGKNLMNNFKLLTSLKNSFKLLNEELNKVQERLDEITVLFNHLSNYSAKYNYDIPKFKDNCEFMKNLMSCYSIYIDNVNKNIKKIIYPDIKNRKDCFETLMFFFEKSVEYNNKYEENKKNLQTKKEELFNRGDTSQWQMSNPEDKFDYSNKELAFSKMCYNDTLKLNNDKILSFYFIHSFNQEFKRIKKLIGDNTYKTYCEFYKSNLKDISAFNNSWETYKSFIKP